MWLFREIAIAFAGAILGLIIAPIVFGLKIGWQETAAIAQALAAAGQLFAAIFLVSLTAKYVKETEKLVTETRNQAVEQIKPEIKILNVMNYMDNHCNIAIENIGKRLARTIVLESEELKCLVIDYFLPTKKGTVEAEYHPNKTRKEEEIKFELIYADSHGKLYKTEWDKGETRYYPI